jgi:LacI family transcriptional regulator
MYMAVEYLHRLGHRRIVGIWAEAPMNMPIPKAQGFQRARDEFSLDTEECYGILDADQFVNGYLLAKNLIASGKEFTAVIGRNDLVALGAMKALKEAGKSVPGDVSVVGYNDTNYAKYSDPALTSVRTPIAESGLRAVEELMALLNGRKKPFSMLELSTEIAVRESTSPKI